MPESGRTIRDVRGRRLCLYAMDGCWRLARPPNCGSEQGQRRASSMPGDAWSCLRSPVAASIKETRRTSCSSTIWSRWYISKSSTSNRSCSSCRPAGSCVIGTHRPLETAPASPEIERISWRAGSSPPRRTCGASSCSTSTVPRPAQPRGRDCRHQQCELETFHANAPLDAHRLHPAHRDDRSANGEDSTRTDRRVRRKPDSAMSLACAFVDEAWPVVRDACPSAKLCVYGD